MIPNKYSSVYCVKNASQKIVVQKRDLSSIDQKSSFHSAPVLCIRVGSFQKYQCSSGPFKIPSKATYYHAKHFHHPISFHWCSVILVLRTLISFKAECSSVNLIEIFAFLQSVPVSSFHKVERKHFVLFSRPCLKTFPIHGLNLNLFGPNFRISNK